MDQIFLPRSCFGTAGARENEENSGNNHKPRNARTIEESRNCYRNLI